MLGVSRIEWLHCDVRVSVPSFVGQLRWSVMPAELRGLADDLERLHGRMSKAGSVSFRPSEPNVALDFSPEHTGKISGTFMFNALLGDGPVLQGPFTIDQSFLPGLVSQLRTFVAEAVGAA